MSTYLEVSGDPGWPGPFRHRGTVTYSYFLKCDVTRLEALVAELNATIASTSAPPVQSLRVAGDFVILQFACCEDARSEVPDLAQFSMATYDLGFSIPVLAQWTSPALVPKLSSPDDWIPEGVVDLATADWLLLYDPFILSDNPASVTAGREVFGYSKQLVQVSEAQPPLPALSGGPNASLLTELRTRVFASDQTGRARWQPNLGIVQGITGPIPSWVPWGGASGQPSFWQRVLQEAVAADLHLYQAAPFSNQTLCLKQFRSESSPVDACYQAAVRVKLERVSDQSATVSPMYRILAGGSGGAVDATIELRDLPSFQPAATLGLVSGEIKPSVVAQTLFDLRVRIP